MTETSGRCPWCGDDPLYVAYHDTEWGVPEYDSRALYEKLMLDGFQAGLAWITILRKRDAFRAAFDGFQPEIVASYGPEKIASLVADAGIVRHRGKIEAAIAGAQAWLEIESKGGFDAFMWRFTDGAPVQNQYASMDQIPVKTPESEAMSKELKKAGFKFCGPVICYAVMQATGMVNDHLIGCPRRSAVATMGEARP